MKTKAFNELAWLSTLIGIILLWAVLFMGCSIPQSEHPTLAEDLFRTTFGLPMRPVTNSAAGAVLELGAQQALVNQAYGYPPLNGYPFAYSPFGFQRPITCVQLGAFITCQ